MLSAAGCGSDKPEEVVFFNNIILSQEYVEMDPAKSVVVEINEGNGDYALTSTRPEIAVAQMEDGKVNVKGVSPGEACIIVTDKKGVNGLISVLVFGDIQLEAEEITVNAGERIFGLPATASTLKITFGNGNYTVTSDNDVEFVVTGKDIEIKAYEFGTLTATIKDRAGRTKKFKINALDPYASLKNSSSNIYTYSKSGDRFDYASSADAVANNYFMYRRSYYSYIDYQLKIPVAQTLSVGKKTGCTFYFYNYFAPAGDIGTVSSPVPVEVVVLKNDGSRVWMVFFNDEISGTVCRPVLATP